jgi:methylglutamate dehydrogenase subunit D
MSSSKIAPGVVASSRDDLAIARIAARKGHLAALACRVREQFGIELPQGPRRRQANELALVGIGVETWLATADTEVNGFAAALRRVFDDVATITDQIGSYTALRMTGPRVREALEKFVAVDLHRRVFDVGSAVSTIASHVPLLLWRLDDSPARLPVFELAVPRSYTESFWRVVAESAAEFGFVKPAAA